MRRNDVIEYIVDRIRNYNDNSRLLFNPTAMINVPDTENEFGKRGGHVT